MKRLLILIVSLAIAPATSALALDRLTVFMLQGVLNDHGFEVGAPDGAIGPATRRGLQAFAERYSTTPDAVAVLQEIQRRSLATRRYITEEAFLEQTREDVSKLLRDPESTTVRNVFIVRDADRDLVCGEVNGRNAFGGYAGFVPFYGMLLMGRFAVIQVDSPQEPIAQLKCSLAFPKN